MKNDKAKTEKEMFDMAVCQNDKRIVCEPQNGNGAGACKTESAVTATVVCSFSNDLWNLGPTCISNHMQVLERTLDKNDVQCPEGKHAAIKSIYKKCRVAHDNGSDNAKCERLGMSF